MTHPAVFLFSDQKLGSVDNIQLGLHPGLDLEIHRGVGKSAILTLISIKLLASQAERAIELIMFIGLGVNQAAPMHP